jgi:hypothetical protein
VQDALTALHEFRRADELNKSRHSRKLANATEVLILSLAQRDIAVADLFDRHIRNVHQQRQG